MHNWCSIDEAPATPQPLVLRGIPALLPSAYGQGKAGKGVWFHIAAVASFLWKCTAWSISILGHLLLVIVLVGVFVNKPEPGEMIVEVSLNNGNAGNHGKAMPETKKDENEESKVEEKKPEEKPDDQKEKPEKKPEKLPKEVPLPPNMTPEIADTTKSDIPKKPSKYKNISKLSKVIGAGMGNAFKAPSNNNSVDGRLIEKDTTAATKARRAGDLAKLRRGSDKHIVVVKGVYDHVERVMDALGVPHTVIKSQDLAYYDLSKCLILLVNCSSNLGRRSGQNGGNVDVTRERKRLEKKVKETEKALDRARERDDRRRERMYRLRLTMYRRSLAYYQSIDRVRQFVKAGGYLFTSDWGLTLVEKAFPGYIQNGGSFGPRTVTIQPRKGKESHPLLRDVFVRKSKNGSTRSKFKQEWEIDSGSYLIRIKNTKVTRLVESRKIPRHRAVAVIFTPAGRGKGMVLHVLSHFAKQSRETSDRYGEFALQNLLLNFMLQRVER